jgi:hypothetical protein
MEWIELKITVFWDVVLCNLEEIYQRLGGTYCLHLQGKRVGSSHPTEDQYARFGALMAVKAMITLLHSEVRSSKFILNIDNFLPDHRRSPHFYPDDRGNKFLQILVTIRLHGVTSKNTVTFMKIRFAGFEWLFVRRVTDVSEEHIASIFKVEE